MFDRRRAKSCVVDLPEQHRCISNDGAAGAQHPLVGSGEYSAAGVADSQAKVVIRFDRSEVFREYLVLGQLLARRGGGVAGACENGQRGRHLCNRRLSGNGRIPPVAAAASRGTLADSMALNREYTPARRLVMTGAMW